MADFLTKIGGLFAGPTDPDNPLSAEDQRRLGRQGLLQMGLSVLANNRGDNPVASIGQGLLAGFQTGQRQLNPYGGYGTPAGMREFAAKAKAAGLKPGTPEYQQAAQIALGLAGRATSAAAQTIERDVNGVPTTFTFDPRTQTYTPATFAAPEAPQEGPLSSAIPAESAPINGGLLDIQGLQSAFASQFPNIPVSSGFRSPEKNAEVGGVPNSFHLTGEAFDVATRTPQDIQAALAWGQQNGLQAINEGDHVHFEPAKRGMTANPLTAGVPIVGRTKEAEAGAVEAAKLGAQIGAQPTLNAMDVQKAAQIAAAEEAAKINAYRLATADVVDRESQVTQARKGAEARADLDTTLAKKTINANETLGLLDEAEKILPNATSGRIAQAGADAAAFVGRSTKGAQGTAKLNLIAAKLIANVPRFEGPQSNIDVQFYREAAGDLANPMLPAQTRLAALETMRQLNQKYANKGGTGNVPATGGWGIKRVK